MDTRTTVRCLVIGPSSILFLIFSKVQNKTLDLSELKMNRSEAYIFGRQRHQVGEIVKEGNRKVGEILNKTQRHESARGLIMDRLSSLAIEIGNYTYLPGGHWKPSNCSPKWKVAIIFPFRNRSYHLPIVLRHLTPMLQKQRLEFAFYVINQGNDLAFNRAMLLNVGFVEALNFSKWDCFIFHDVDHVPISDFNYYGCNDMPRHFISGADRWQYKLPYGGFFGGVTGLTTGNVYKINGFPNVYWGWGGEDDELWKRVKEAKLPISRPTGPTGYYNVIKHHHVREKPMKERFKLLKSFKSRFQRDGLNNLRYEKPFLLLDSLYTNISVNIQKLNP